MHNALGNVWRGLVAAAIVGNAASLVAAIDGTIEWKGYLTASITTIAMLVGALVDPGSQPPK